MDKLTPLELLYLEERNLSDAYNNELAIFHTIILTALCS